MNKLDILKKYWGFDQFRPLQEEIIDDVLNGFDVLGVLPTGAGKSLCYQLPALLLEGVCIVITPLIALMEDQVQQLKNKKIKAVGLHSGLSAKEIDLYLDNCIYGDTKFLFISPERINSELFIERFKKIKVSLIVVDEAHCISQWGYDFRPSYLNIKELRTLNENSSILALTASATIKVRKDICSHLEFSEQSKNHFSSFFRKELSYSVISTDNKLNKVLYLLQRVKDGSALVYCSTRKETLFVSDFLNKNKINCDFYHGGLSNVDRKKRQDDWLLNRKRVMICTNAFGMGIDKPDVRIVINYSLPLSIEGYYQEAGRAGRDKKKSYAVLLFDSHDTNDLRKKHEQKFPSIEFIRRVYNALANSKQLAIGSYGKKSSFDFDITSFTELFSLPFIETYNALDVLEKEGLILMNSFETLYPRIKILLEKHRLYEYQVNNPDIDLIIKAILRIVGPETLDNYTRINISSISSTVRMEINQVIETLNRMNNAGIVDFINVTSNTQISFSQPRQATTTVLQDTNKYNTLKLENERKVQSVIQYIQLDKNCRAQYISQYFDEDLKQPCLICDNCVQTKKESGVETKLEILKILENQNMTIENIQKITNQKESYIIEAIKDMCQEGIVEYNSNGLLTKK